MSIIFNYDPTSQKGTALFWSIMQMMSQWYITSNLAAYITALCKIRLKFLDQTFLTVRTLYYHNYSVYTQKVMINQIIRLSINRPYAVLIPIIILTAFFGYMAFDIQINTDMKAMIPSTDIQSSFVEEYGRVQRDFDYFVLTVTSDNLFESDGLQALYQAIEDMKQIGIFSTPISPFTYTTFETVGTRIRPVIPSPRGRAPSTEEEIAYFQEKLERDHFAENLVISPDSRTLSVFFPQTIKTNELDHYMQLIYQAIEPLHGYFDVRYIGTIPYALQTLNYLAKDIVLLLSLAILFMAILFYLGFRANRAVLLPMLVVIIGMIWSVGVMAMLRFPITVISVSLPPVILALGSSYTIHMLNQYMRDSVLLVTPAFDASNPSWMISGLRKISRTILIAGITTLIGFSSLLFSNIEQIRHYGLGAIVGIATCMLLSLSFLPAALSLSPSPKTVSANRVLEGHLSKLMNHAGNHILKRYPVYIGLSIILAAACLLLYGSIQQKTDYLEYYPKDDPVILNTAYIVENIGSFQYVYITLNAPDNQSNYFLNSDVLKQVYAYEQAVGNMPDVVHHSSFASYVVFLNSLITGDESIPDSRGLILTVSRIFKLASLDEVEAIGSFVNEDYSEISIILRIYDSESKLFIYDEDLKSLLLEIQSKRHLLPPEVSLAMWGWSLRFADLADILRDDQNTSLLISSIGVALVAMIFFTSFQLGFIALIPLALGLCITYISMALFNIPMDMSSAMMASIAIGVGADDAIHFLIHYREMQRANIGIEESIKKSIAVTGRPILLTSLAIVGGLLLLTFASFKPIAFFGALISLALTGACAGTILVLPSWLIFIERIKKRFSPIFSNIRM